MIFLGLGSNLPSKYGNRFTNINLAISFIEGYGIKVIKKSSFYETPSYPNKKNPKFINAVILIETILSPTDLMSVLIFIESSPSPVKYAANLLKLCSDEVRLPLVGVTAETKEKVKSAMQQANLI